MKTKKVVSGLFLLVGLEALGSLVYLLMLPSDPKNAVLWGYSAARLAMGFVLLAAVAGCGILFYFALRHTDKVVRRMDWLSEKPGWLWVTGVILAFIATLALVAVWMPAYRYGNKLLFYERLFPVILWVCLSSGQGLIAFLIWRDVVNFSRLWRAIQAEKGLWWFVAAGLSLFAFLLVIASRMGFLTLHDVMQFNPPGVPLLPLQVFTVWLAGVFFLTLFRFLQSWKTKSKLLKFPGKKDRSIFVIIWIIAAIIWISVPMQPTFFAPMQRPPDGVMFPYSDAALYDRTAQFALMGLGLRNGAYVDKPLYSSFLTILHLIGGQDFDLITALQASVFSLLPALAFALGRKLHSRTAGIAAALLVIFRGVNAIAGGHWIQTAHARLLLSEMPTALAMGFLIYFVLCWYENPRDHLYPVLAGGVLGLSTLIRHNPWLLVPIIVLVATIVYWRQWKQWFIRVILFGLAMMLVISPWMYYSWKTVGTPWYFMIPLRGVVWKGRLQPEITESSFAPELENNAVESSVGFSSTGGILLSNGRQVLPDLTQSATGFGRVAQILAVHFYNNLRGSLFCLPVSWAADDLEHTLTAPDSLWMGGWTDSISPLMVLNVFIILLGVGASWKKLRIASTAPLVVYLGYLSAVSLARTSGGRYLVPVDWVLLLYYAIGIVQIIAWVIGVPIDNQHLDDGNFDHERIGTRHWLGGIIGLLLVSGMIPFAQEAIPLSVPSNSEMVMPSSEWMEEAGIDPVAVDEFLGKEGAVVRFGKAVYPRFYSWYEGESSGCFGPRAYPRLVFELIGAEGEHCVSLPYVNMTYDMQLQYSTVIALGCEGGGNWMVMFPEKGLALVRFTQSEPPTCPLAYPKCADNRNCW